MENNTIIYYMKKILSILLILFSFVFAEKYTVLKVFHSAETTHGRFVPESYTFICIDSKSKVFQMNIEAKNIYFERNFKLVETIEVQDFNGKKKVIWYM
jgi:hypothetical protein